jgi:hypothetical protein
MGSEKYPHKGILDLLANRAFSEGTGAITNTDHTTYSVSTAGSQGFLQLLPIYVDHILYPTLTDAGYVLFSPQRLALLRLSDSTQIRDRGAQISFGCFQYAVLIHNDRYTTSMKEDAILGSCTLRCRVARTIQGIACTTGWLPCIRIPLSDI